MCLADHAKAKLHAQVDIAINGGQPLCQQAILEYQRKACFYVRHLNSRAQLKMVTTAEREAQVPDAVPVWNKSLDFNTLKRHESKRVKMEQVEKSKKLLKQVEPKNNDDDDEDDEDEDDFVAPAPKKMKNSNNSKGQLVTLLCIVRKELVSCCIALANT
jgi:hypothetical protein